MNSLGDRLKEERLRLGFKKGEFAALGGVASNAQHFYETGKRKPRADYLAAIGRGGADIMYICMGARCPVPEQALTTREAEIMSFYRSLDGDDKQAVERLLESLALMRSSS
jgi:transcriptional regulator with XRE-family HTH domain